MKRRGYSLQKAVFQARQRSQEERDRFMLRLKENTTYPRQYIVIDEVHKGAKEERHLRAWGLRGKMPVLEEDFDRGFTKRYTMIGAAHISLDRFQIWILLEERESSVKGSASLYCLSCP